MMRHPDLPELTMRSRTAILLAMMIGFHARWNPGRPNIYGLEFGAARINYLKWGLSHQEFKTARKMLEQWGMATFRSTKAGTIGKLTATSVFTPFESKSNQQPTNSQPTDQRTDNQQPAKIQPSGPATANHQQELKNLEPRASTPPSPFGGKRARVTSREPTDEEMQLYEAYPRKDRKPFALRAIRRALKSYSFTLLLERTRAYAKARKGCDPQYTPYPAKWFKGEQFNDDPATWGSRGTGAGKPKPAIIRPENFGSGPTQL
jgi:hypothetical protein